MTFSDDKYTITWADRQNRTHLVELYPTGYSGSATALTPAEEPLDYTFGQPGDDPFKPLNPTDLTLRVIVNDSTLYDDIKGDAEETWGVIWKIDGTEQWRGYILPDEIEQPIDTGEVLTLRCACGLSFLADADGSAPSSESRQGILPLVADLLGRLSGTGYGIGAAADWHSSGGSGNSYAEYEVSPLAYKDQEATTTNTWTKAGVILSQLAGRFAGRLFMARGKWRLVQREAITGSSYSQDLYDSSGADTASNETVSRYSLTSANAIGEGATLKPDRQYNAVEVRYTHGPLGTSLFSNRSFEGWDSGLPVGWDFWDEDGGYTSANVTQKTLASTGGLDTRGGRQNDRRFNYGVLIDAIDNGGTKENAVQNALIGVKQDATGVVSDTQGVVVSFEAKIDIDTLGTESPAYRPAYVGLWLDTGGTDYYWDPASETWESGTLASPPDESKIEFLLPYAGGSFSVKTIDASLNGNVTFPTSGTLRLILYNVVETFSSSNINGVIYDNVDIQIVENGDSEDGTRLSRQTGGNGKGTFDAGVFHVGQGPTTAHLGRLTRDSGTHAASWSSSGGSEGAILGDLHASRIWKAKNNGAERLSLSFVGSSGTYWPDQAFLFDSTEYTCVHLVYSARSDRYVGEWVSTGVSSSTPTDGGTTLFGWTLPTDTGGTWLTEGLVFWGTPDKDTGLGPAKTYLPTSLNTILASSLTAGGILMGSLTGDLDDISDGTNYGRMLNSALSSGAALLSAAVGDLDDIANGSTYGKVNVTSISAGNILLAQTTGNLDDISDGTTYAKVKATFLSAGEILLANVGGDLDDVSDGTSYKKWNANGVPPSATSVSGSGLYLGTDKMGFYDGTRWSTYMDNSGNLVLVDSNGGTSFEVYVNDGGTLQKSFSIEANTALDGYVILGSDDATSMALTSEDATLSLHGTNSFFLFGEPRAILTGSLVAGTDSAYTLGITGTRWSGVFTDAINGITWPTGDGSSGQAIVTDGAGTASWSSLAGTLGGVLEDLDTLGAPASDGQFIVATGAGAFAYESGSTARASLGLTIGTHVQAYHANLAAIAGGTWTGATSLTTLGTITTGIWNGTAVNEGYGGTGITTYTTGDLIYASASNTLSKLAIGTDTYVLSVSSGVPAWVSGVNASKLAGGTLTITSPSSTQYLHYNGSAWINAGLNASHINAGTVGDTYISESSVTQHEAALSITESQISDFGSYASASHTHAASAITSGTLAVTRGGTGLGTYSLYDLLYIDNVTGAPTFGTVGIGTSGQALIVGGSGPTWGGHDDLSGYVANEHIDWTGASSNFSTSGFVDAGEARMATWAGSSTYAFFGNEGMNTTTDYALIQGDNGATYLNSKAGQPLSLRINNANVYQISAAGAHNFQSGSITTTSSVTAASLALSGALSGATTGTFSSNVTVGGTLGVGTGISTTPNTDADDLWVENAGSAGISILSGNTSAGSIYFGDSDASQRGAIVYLHSADSLNFYTAGASLRASVSSSGAWDFQSGNLTTTGTLSAGATTVTGLTVNGSATITATAISGAETIQTWNVSDDATGYISVTNQTGSALSFQPGFTSRAASTTIPRLDLAIVTTDSGSNPAFVLDGRLSGGALSTRPVLQMRSYGNIYYSLEAGGNHDFKSGTATFGGDILASAGTEDIGSSGTPFANGYFTTITTASFTANSYSLGAAGGIISSSYDRTDQVILASTTAYKIWDGTTTFLTLDSTNNRLSMSSGLDLLWGGDTNLYRSAANTLKTDDSLSVSGQIQVSGGVTSPTAGTGVEIQWNSGTSLGEVFAYDRSLSAWKAIRIRGSNIQLEPQSSAVLINTTSAVGSEKLRVNGQGVFNDDVVAYDGSTAWAILRDTPALGWSVGTMLFGTYSSYPTTGWTQRGAWNATGLLIGTSGTASYTLDVSGTVRATGAVTFGSTASATIYTATGGTAVVASQASGSDLWLIQQSGYGNQGLWWDHSDSSWHFLSGGSSRWNVDTSGNVQQDGALQVDGATTLSSTLTVSGHTDPGSATTYDLGASARWRTFYGQTINITGEIDVATGTNTDPGYAFQGETNTGMYRSSAGEISWTLLGTQTMVLSSGALTVGGNAVATSSTNIGTFDGTLNLDKGGTGVALSDPGEQDTLMYWDNSVNAITWLEIGSGLSINTLGTPHILSVDFTGYLSTSDVDDTPVNGATTAPVSSNWAYDHENASNPHSITAGGIGAVGISGTETITGAKTFSSTVVLANSRYLYGTHSGGGTYNLIGMNGSNNIVLGQSSTGSLYGYAKVDMNLFAESSFIVRTGTTPAARLTITDATTSVSNDLAVTGDVTGANLAVSNWNTAYGWGDHSGAGYLEDDASATVTALWNFTGGLTISSATVATQNWVNGQGFLTSSSTISATKITAGAFGGGDYTFSGDVIPNTDGTRSLGSSSNEWGTVYTNGIYSAIDFTLGASNTISGSIRPGVTQLFDLGSSSYEWYEVFAHDGTFSGDVNVDGTVTDGLSDARYKTDWRDIDGLSIIRQLRPGFFRYTDDAPGGFSGRAGAGFEAQALVNVYDYAVQQRKDGFFTLRYQELVTPLVAAVQELEAQVSELRAELARNKRKNK